MKLMVFGWTMRRQLVPASLKDDGIWVGRSDGSNLVSWSPSFGAVVAAAICGRVSWHG